MNGTPKTTQYLMIDIKLNSYHSLGAQILQRFIPDFSRRANEKSTNFGLTPLKSS